MVQAILEKAQDAFMIYKSVSGKAKAAFLRSIALEIEALGEELIKTASAETNLPEARILSERGRTVGQLRMFAELVEEGSWLEARIDTALPERTPLPKPDIRKMMVPIGPVVVFGASNFPMAYSTAGGDTASALAAGCPVIVKAHPAHLKTSEMVAGAIIKALKANQLHEGVFQHVSGGFELGQALVKHPYTKAVGFTGSFAGGKALFDIASQRTDPIPVFAEMGSVNPVILLPETLQENATQTAKTMAASITLGAGQFCTNPGLMFAIQGAGLDLFSSVLKEEIEKVLPDTMLHQGIAENYRRNMKERLEGDGVSVLAQSSLEAQEMQGRPMVATIRAEAFIQNPAIAEEVFGPFSLLVIADDDAQLSKALLGLKGQLTSTIIAKEEEILKHPDLLTLLSEKAGRLIINGVPTGVEVCPSMNHGGPFPATTDSRFTAVGRDAIKRFVRPLSFQNFPNALLPDELKNENPLGILRLFNNEWKR